MNFLDKMRVCLKSHGAPGVMIHGGTQSLEFCANSSIEKDDLSLFKPGDEVTVLAGDAVFPTINEVFRYCHSKGANPTFLRQLLAAPLAEKMRAEMQARLTKAEQQTSPLPGF